MCRVRGERAHPGGGLESLFGNARYGLKRRVRGPFHPNVGIVFRDLGLVRIEAPQHREQTGADLRGVRAHDRGTCPLLTNL